MVAMAEGRTGRWRWQRELDDGGDGRGNWATIVAMAEGTGRWWRWQRELDGRWWRWQKRELSDSHGRGN
jgi:hypothetical protein